MEIKKRKRVLLENEASVAQIWTMASSLDVKGNKAIKKFVVFH